MLDTILNQYKRLKTRERILAVAFVVVISVVFYHRFVYKPLKKNIDTYKFQIQKISTRLDELKYQFPKLDEKKEGLRKQEAENLRIINRISDMEKIIPAKQDTSRLISEITRKATGFELASIQQRMDEGDIYSRLYIELAFNAQYKELINFIDGIGAVSPFLKVEEMSISEDTGKSKKGGLAASILLSCLLQEEKVTDWISSNKTAGGAISIDARDIFKSSAKPVVVDKTKEKERAAIKLEGITYTTWSQTAIINDNVVRIGSEVDGYKVKDIGPYAVTLTDGVEDITLTIER